MGFVETRLLGPALAAATARMSEHETVRPSPRCSGWCWAALPRTCCSFPCNSTPALPWRRYCLLILANLLSLRASIWSLLQIIWRARIDYEMLDLYWNQLKSAGMLRRKSLYSTLLQARKAFFLLSSFRLLSYIKYKYLNWSLFSLFPHEKLNSETFWNMYPQKPVHIELMWMSLLESRSYLLHHMLCISKILLQLNCRNSPWVFRSNRRSKTQTL